MSCRTILVCGWLLAVLAVFGSPREAASAVILDQEHVATDIAGLSIFDDSTFRQEVAQTFTAGISGTLSRIEVQINAVSGAVDNVTIDIRPVDGAGVPLASDASSLFSITLTPADFPTFFSSDFTSIDVSAAAIAVSPGDMLAITARSDDDLGYPWPRNSPGLYANGASHFRFVAGGSWGMASTVDAGFRTFVETSSSTVPEPTSFALFGLGVVGLVGCCWRRRSARSGDHRT